MIPTRIHAALDYLVGGLFILLGAVHFDLYAPEGAILFALGGATILYSLLTRDELGAIPVIPMNGHLALDAANGVLLASSPFLFAFADRIWMPHVGLGIMELMVVALSAHTPREIGYHMNDSV